MANEKDAAAEAAGEEKLVSNAAEKPEAEADETEADDAAEDGEEAEGDETAEGEKAEGEADDEGKPSKSKLKRERVKERIRTLEDIARHESQRADAVAAQLKAITGDVGPEPKFEDYGEERRDEFNADRAAWKVEARLAARQKTTITASVKEAQDAASKSKLNLFRERTMALTDLYPDAEAKVLNDPTLPIDGQTAEILMDSERGPEVAYYLATHREELQRIQGMQPLARARELGRIEAKITAPKPKTQTQAPKPVPVVGGGSSKAAKDPEKMTTDEWLAWRNAQLGLAPGRKKVS